MERSIYVIGDIHGDYSIIDARFGELKGTKEKHDVESIMDSDMVFYDREIMLTVIGSRTMSFVFVK